MALASGAWALAVTEPTLAESRCGSSATRADKSRFWWSFDRGTLLYFDPSGAVYRTREDGSHEELARGPLRQIPGDTTRTYSSGITMFTASERHSLVHAQIGQSFKVFTADGKAVDVPLDPRAFREDNQVPDWTSHHATVNGSEFLVLSIGYAYLNDMIEYKKTTPDATGTLNTGETFVVRDDGALLRIDFRFHARELGNEILIKDGLVSFRNSEGFREIDLKHFDRELKFKTRYVQPIHDSEGNAADPALFTRAFTRNLTLEAREDASEYEPLDAATRDTLRRAMIKRELGSVAILGPAGAGKSELVKRLIIDVRDGRIPEIPRSTLFLEIDSSTLGGGSRYIGTMEARINALIRRSEMGPVVLVMDEIHGLSGQGTHSSNHNDLFQWLKPQLASGVVRIIGMSTMPEFFRAFSHDTPLLERFQILELPAASAEESIARYAAWARKQGFPVPAPDVLKRAYLNSEKFNPVGAQPRKGIRILNDAYADLEMRGERGPPTSRDVDQATARMHRISPRDFELPAIQQKILALPGKLDARVIGQSRAKQILLRQGISALAGANDPHRPRMSVIFTGPKGVGKTELAFAYGEALELPVARIMMNRFSVHSRPEEFLLLLKEALEKNAFTIFLLDEADKAPRPIIEALLDILDKGRFSMPEHTAKGTRVASADVSAVNASFIIVGNFDLKAHGAGLPTIGFHQPESSAGESEEELRNALVGQGLSEFVVDRVQDVVEFTYLSKEEFRRVLEMHADAIINQQAAVHGRGISLNNREEFLFDLVERHFSPRMSNRTALRLLNQDLRTTIALALLSSSRNKNDDLVIDILACNELLSSAGKDKK
ncbi:MAG: AAA family ATPase [Calothrix sp. SM1_5_4]|nr:AAA family ATPase [Calothrix sp. SM1_5_4]